MEWAEWSGLQDPDPAEDPPAVATPRLHRDCKRTSSGEGKATASRRSHEATRGGGTDQKGRPIAGECAHSPWQLRDQQLEHGVIIV